MYKDYTRKFFIDNQERNIKNEEEVLIECMKEAYSTNIKQETRVGPWGLTGLLNQIN